MNAIATPVARIEFPPYTGARCLMMPYVQGDPTTVPDEYQGYADILRDVFVRSGDIGYLTIDESTVTSGTPHRGARTTTERALHTEAGRIPGVAYVWGGGGWGRDHRVTLDADVQVLLANNVPESCALWDAEHADTSLDGDLGHALDQYPMGSAIIMQPGAVHRIGILTPHESLPMRHGGRRQFLRIVSSGVHGREPYFTKNPMMPEEDA